MKYYYWTEEITIQSFQRFTDFINDNKDEEITLYFESIGGSHILSQLLVIMINQHVTKMVITFRIFSAGFFVVYHVKVPLVFGESVIGMWHYGMYSPVTLSSKNGKACYTDDKKMIKGLKILKKTCEILAKAVMTKKEMLRFKKDKDIYFGYRRMREIFPKAELVKVNV